MFVHTVLQVTTTIFQSGNARRFWLLVHGGKKAGLAKFGMEKVGMGKVGTAKVGYGKSRYYYYYYLSLFISEQFPAYTTILIGK